MTQIGSSAFVETQGIRFCTTSDQQIFGSTWYVVADTMSAEDATEILAVDLVGVVPDDEQVVIATNQGEILSRDQGLAGAAYDNICHRICGEEIPISGLYKI